MSQSAPNRPSISCTWSLASSPARCLLLVLASQGLTRTRSPSTVTQSRAPGKRLSRCTKRLRSDDLASGRRPGRGNLGRRRYWVGDALKGVHHAHLLSTAFWVGSFPVAAEWVGDSVAGCTLGF